MVVAVDHVHRQARPVAAGFEPLREAGRQPEGEHVLGHPAVEEAMGEPEDSMTSRSAIWTCRGSGFGFRSLPCLRIARRSTSELRRSIPWMS